MQSVMKWQNIQSIVSKSWSPSIDVISLKFPTSRCPIGTAWNPPLCSSLLAMGSGSESLSDELEVKPIDSLSVGYVIGCAPSADPSELELSVVAVISDNSETASLRVLTPRPLGVLGDGDKCSLCDLRDDLLDDLFDDRIDLDDVPRGRADFNFSNRGDSPWPNCSSSAAMT